MVFGMTRGEIGLVIFVFALVWGAGLLPALGERLGQRLYNRRVRGARSSSDDDGQRQE